MDKVPVRYAPHYKYKNAKKGSKLVKAKQSSMEVKAMTSSKTIYLFYDLLWEMHWKGQTFQQNENQPCYTSAAKLQVYSKQEGEWVQF